MFWDMIALALSADECGDRRVTLTAQREQVPVPADQARDHPLDSLGDQHSHRYCVSLQRIAWPILLADAILAPRFWLRRSHPPSLLILLCLALRN